MDEHAVAEKTDELPPGRVMTHFNQRNLDSSQLSSDTARNGESFWYKIINCETGRSSRNVKHGLVCLVISTLYKDLQ